MHLEYVSPSRPNEGALHSLVFPYSPVEGSVTICSALGTDRMTSVFSQWSLLYSQNLGCLCYNLGNFSAELIWWSLSKSVAKHEVRLAMVSLDDCNKTPTRLWVWRVWGPGEALTVCIKEIIHFPFEGLIKLQTFFSLNPFGKRQMANNKGDTDAILKWSGRTAQREMIIIN